MYVLVSCRHLPGHRHQITQWVSYMLNLFVPFQTAIPQDCCNRSSNLLHLCLFTLNQCPIPHWLLLVEKGASGGQLTENSVGRAKSHSLTDRMTATFPCINFVFSSTSKLPDAPPASTLLLLAHATLPCGLKLKTFLFYFTSELTVLLSDYERDQTITSPSALPACFVSPLMQLFHYIYIYLHRSKQKT